MYRSAMELYPLLNVSCSFTPSWGEADRNSSWSAQVAIPFPTQYTLHVRREGFNPAGT